MQLPIIIIDDILHQNLQVSVWLQMVRHEMPPAISRLFPNWATCPGSKSKPFSRLGSRWGYQGIWGCLDMPSGFWYTDWYHLKQIGRLSPYHKQTLFRLHLPSAILHQSCPSTECSGPFPLLFAMPAWNQKCFDHHSPKSVAQMNFQNQ